MPRLSLPWAILIAGFAIGGGLSLGLRGKPEAPPGATSLAEPVNAPAKIDPALEQRARQALEAERTRLVRACWSAPEVQQASFDVRLIFSGRGELLSYGVNDPEDVRLLPIAACLWQQKLSISVPAQGRPISMRFPFELP